MWEIQGTMKLSRFAKSLAASVNVKRREKGLLPRPVGFLAQSSQYQSFVLKFAAKFTCLLHELGPLPALVWNFSLIAVLFTWIRKMLLGPCHIMYDHYRCHEIILTISIKLLSEKEHAIRPPSFWFFDFQSKSWQI